MKKYENQIQYEFECQCGYVWIDDHNYGCLMCQNHTDIIRRNYNIRQPCFFGKRKKD